MTAKNAKDSNNKTESSSLPFEIRERAKDRPLFSRRRKRRTTPSISQEKDRSNYQLRKLDAVLTAIGSLKLQQHIMIQKVRARVKSIQFPMVEVKAAQNGIFR